MNAYVLVPREITAYAIISLINGNYANNIGEIPWLQ